MSAVSFFRLSSKDTESYALIASGIGGALFEIIGDQAVVTRTSGRMSPEVAGLLLSGLAGRSAGVDCIRHARMLPSFPDVVSFDQLCAFLELIDVARNREDLSRITGLTHQRIKQLVTQTNTMPTRRVFDRLREFCSSAATPHKETLSDIIELLSSRAKERLKTLYERGE